VKLVCNECGTEYGDHAEFCNVCGAEQLYPLIDSSEEDPDGGSVRDDGQALAMSGFVWLVGIGVMISVHRPRDAYDLFIGWVLLTGFTFVLGLSLRSMRSTMLFSLLALPFLGVYWYLKLLR
jgi:hypothetical protein